MTTWQAMQMGFLYIWFGFSLAAILALFLSLGYYHRQLDAAQAELVILKAAQDFEGKMVRARVTN